MSYLTDTEKRILFSALSREKKLCETDEQLKDLVPVIESLEQKFRYDRFEKEIQKETLVPHETYLYMNAIISTAHIKPETAELLDEAAETPFSLPGISVMSKTEYGYSLCAAFDLIDEKTLPEDLKDCLAFIKKIHCNYLRFDSDGEVLDELPDYTEEWSRAERSAMR